MNKFGTMWRSDRLKELCKKYSISVSELRGRRRNRYLVDARRKIAFDLQKCGYTRYAIGDMLNRDHTSVTNLLIGKKR